ncbi:DUF1499 domain containing protein [Nitzschia inconspicua]|uniref:DUF1499 domain containing protein n=1 Tax=Nitzschia inconspicua TaxID=303405 RepID=A0A9K3KW99_9STRA|nr:DUF1499 domain containing protein [Nitzschia inconspicua]
MMYLQIGSVLLTMMSLLGGHVTEGMVSSANGNKDSRFQTKAMVTDCLVTRQQLFQKTAASVISTGVFTMVSPMNSASAFENRVSDQYMDRPKQRGSKPKDLGVGKRIDLSGNDYVGLKPCGRSPNCFVSSTNEVGEPDDFDLDHSIPSWKWPSSMNEQQAFDDVLTTLKSYPPGQSNIDGGGFQIVTIDPKAGYIYVQYESLKNGYIDDAEFAFLKGSLQVRSSSRLGYLDFGVNAKRLNFIAKALREKGWNAPGVDYKTHQNYVIQNELE